MGWRQLLSTLYQWATSSSISALVVVIWAFYWPTFCLAAMSLWSIIKKNLFAMLGNELPN
jgi:hypothetical protein